MEWVFEPRFSSLSNGENPAPCSPGRGGVGCPALCEAVGRGLAATAGVRLLSVWLRQPPPRPSPCPAPARRVSELGTGRKVHRSEGLRRSSKGCEHHCAWYFVHIRSPVFTPPSHRLGGGGKDIAKDSQILMTPQASFCSRPWLSLTWR